MKTNRTTFAFSDTEKKMLDRLCEIMGCNPSELFRGFIRDKYLKLFPPYAEKKVKMIIEEEELTDEQFCEKMGGTVVKSDAGLKCQLRSGGSLLQMLVSDREAIEKNARNIAKVKNI